MWNENISIKTIFVKKSWKNSLLYYVFFHNNCHKEKEKDTCKICLHVVGFQNLYLIFLNKNMYMYIVQ